MKKRQVSVKSHLQRRFTLRVLFLVTLPVLVVILMLLIKNEQDINADLLKAHNQTTKQLLDSMQSYCAQIDHSAMLLQNDSVLSTFLNRPYKAGVDYNTYANAIRARFNYIIDSGDNKSTFLFHSNETIPSGFGFFYSEHFLKDDPLLVDFLADPNAEVGWFFHHANSPFAAFHPLAHTLDTLMYIRKLKPLNRSAVTAYVVTQVPIPTLINVSGFTHNALFSKENATLTYNFTQQEPSQKVLTALLRKKADTERTAGAFYSICPLLPLPFQLITITSSIGGISNYLIICLVLLAMLPLINFIFVHYWTNMIRSIQRMIREARRALVGDSSFRLHPTDDKDLNVIVDSVNYLLQRVSWLLAEVVRQENATRDAQLLALQHQINPHFIYNTMELLAGRMELHELYKESDALSDFAHLFRYNLNAAHEATTLSSEVANVERYLGIQRLLRSDVDLVKSIEPCLLSLPMMRFALQPLVENSLEHGGHKRSELLTLTLQAITEGAYARISLMDNGIGMSAEQLLQVRSHLQTPDEGNAKDSIGLFNIHSRLQLLYNTSLTIESTEGEGTTVSFLVPLP
ncbi:MAG: histidine kinase [Clostridia bacterium]